MSVLIPFQNLYTAYTEKVEEILKNRKVTEGLLGLSKGPKDNPCHDLFISDLEKEISSFSETLPSSGEVFALLDFMYTEPLKHKGNDMVYWMFCAVHTLVYDLIERLSPEDAKTLYARYQENYLRHERLPAQKKTLKALKEKARQDF